MAKRTTNGGTMAANRGRKQAGGASGDGNSEDRPTLTVKTNDKGQVFSPIRQKWLAETPEERVRQAYVVMLHNEYGFDLDQMDEELHVAGRGSARARADVVIWRTPQDKTDSKAPLIAVECKADNVTIKAADYAQGEAYALYTNAPFFVTHNNRETRYWRTRKELLPGHCEEIENIPHADASDKDIQELIAKLKTFKEDEFADLLHSCHNVIRNRERASVKASLLFLGKFTQKEQADFDKKRAAAGCEVEAKHAGEIAAETARLEGTIEAAKQSRDAEGRKAAQGELREYLKRMEETKTREARALLKERFDYPVFLYEAEKVGITATGEPDANELYPNERMPASVKAEETCLELYRRFRKNPKAFLLEEGQS